MRVTRRRTIRRTLSGLGVATVLGSAGCLGSSGREPEGPDGTPPELVCEDESFRRLEPPFSEELVSDTTFSADGDPRFELALDGRTVAYGSELRVVLRNRTSEPRSTGPRHAFGLQRETESGWQDLRGTTDGDPLDAFDGATTDEDAVVHDPGEGFVWELTLTESGVAEASPSASLSVCPPLGTGRYRFVYWGIPDGTIAGEFDVVGPG